jgi:hypothetical protein
MERHDDRGFEFAKRLDLHKAFINPMNVQHIRLMLPDFPDERIGEPLCRYLA